ncbi:hypothetical protein L1887_34541 [Cichorium endivia]|nr:hypothetical protein L1887_34541 [Cichorium endivia]
MMTTTLNQIKRQSNSFDHRICSFCAYLYDSFSAAGTLASVRLSPSKVCFGQTLASVHETSSPVNDNITSRSPLFHRY